MQAEGSPCAWNPLDTTEDASGATSCNSVGVKNYPDEGTGTSATCRTLADGARGYASIVAGFKASADPTTTGSAIASSAWGTGSLALECIEDANNDPSTFNSWAAKSIAT